MAEQPAKPKRPKGKAQAWTERDLDDLSAVTPRDQSAAALWWREHAPPGFKNLLDAEPMEPDA